MERENLSRSWDFPAGQRPIRSNEDGSVLAIETGIGTIRAATTITALGLDPRFDFSKAYWHGAKLNEWANAWVRYFSGGNGNYVTTAMEDSGTLHALAMLEKAGRVDTQRVLVLRTASNFDMQWPGADAAGSLSGEKLGEGYSAYIPALEAAHRVGSRVVHAWLAEWERFSESPPGR